MFSQEFMDEIKKNRDDSLVWYRDWEYEGEEIWIPGRECPIRCRIYRPTSPVSQKLPVFFDFHGGGWACHKCEADQPFCTKIADRLGIMVVSVDYRLAPEYKYPTPTKDGFDVIQHFYQNAEKYGIDPMNMGIGGHSAGGQISISIALEAKEKNAFPLKCMILDYPAVDCNLNFSKVIEHQGYITEYQKEFVSISDFFQRCEFATVEQMKDYHCSPIYGSVEQLSDLPPALIIACENDLLRFSNFEFAQKLMEAGVEVTFKLFKGVIHGFTADLYYTPEAEEGHKMMLEGIKKYLIG